MMLLSASIFALPSSLILLILTAPTFSSAESNISHTLEVQDKPLQWPHNLPAHIKYWPDDPPHQRRDLDFLLRRMQDGETPGVVRKMSGDEGEMFFHDYWSFEALGRPRREILLGESSSINAGLAMRGYRDSDEEAPPQNSSAVLSYRPAYALHIQDGGVSDTILRRANANRIPEVFRRGTCPVGTNDCSTIGYPNSCCAPGESCIQITDTGLGPVGCCPSGGTCAGTVSSCAAGQTACAQQLGGGCCIAGFQCSGVGCVQLIIVTVTSVFTVSSTPTTSIITSTMMTSSAAGPPTDTALQTTLACATNARACPINLGGGCCATDRICTTGMLCPLSPGLSTDISTVIVTSTSSATVTSGPPASTTGTAVASAPVRPTSSEQASAPESTTGTPGTCPTGFYQCSAYYNAGSCCRVGRDCKTTDCPATASTTLVSNGVTVVVQLTGAATSFATSAGGSVCANGWSTCAGGGATAGGCCPTGYACGEGSCTSAAATATGVVGKGAVGNGAGRVAIGGGWLGVSLLGTALICLWL